ncbi:PRC-barrel domain-containing protein [Sphingopyxis sp.]|uniref:PRC-barrel domain-containing protein n=1 Tax=Sphingopyxis sp. TaxID=1908224 RepID=UPI002ED82C0F
MAPVATMIAAMMTAANLGARVTGWGFIVFTVGSIGWSLVGLGSGQTNLVATNVFLTLVNLVGVWRWLGRQRCYEDGARSASRSSRKSPGSSLFSATSLSGLPVSDMRGETVGSSVDAMIECETGRVSYIVVASGGLGGIEETLRPVPLASVDCHADGLILLETKSQFERRPELGAGEWPARVPGADRRKSEASGRSAVDKEDLHATV